MPAKALDPNNPPKPFVEGMSFTPPGGDETDLVASPDRAARQFHRLWYVPFEVQSKRTTLAKSPNQVNLKAEALVGERLSKGLRLELFGD
jgi:hypothetical protein